MAPEPVTRAEERLTPRDVCYAVNIGMACLIAYSVSTHVIAPVVDEPDAHLAGIWTTLTTVLVFRTTRGESRSVGIGRLIGTGVSFALCLAYLLVLPFHPAGLAVLIVIGTLLVMVLNRRSEIVTVGITTVIGTLLVAATRTHPWHQPILRLVDTVVGIAVGAACEWAGSFLYYRLAGKQAR